MADENEKEKLSARRPFLLASDEGYINSEAVTAIVKEGTASAGKYKGHRVTILRLDTPKIGDSDNLRKPYIRASMDTVLELFEDHGYDVIGEEALKQRDAAKLRR